ncbi:hypothetical protein TorRG33x02_248360, partial [Trema orientale]
YERLPDFCFRCSGIRHRVRECIYSGEAKNDAVSSDFRYRNWLKVPPLRPKIPKSKAER